MEAHSFSSGGVETKSGRNEKVIEMPGE